MMKKLVMLLALVALAVFTVDQAFAKPIEIHWWHAMRGARGETCNTMIKKFNASQDKYVVVGTNKGNYDETGQCRRCGHPGQKTAPHPAVL
jgi:sn-glycerol 3-phosphate transport system substrate-binding protein